MKLKKYKAIFITALCIAALSGCGTTTEQAEQTDTNTAITDTVSDVYTYPFLGLNITLPKSMKTLMESENLFLIKSKEMTADESALSYAVMLWCATDKEKQADAKDNSDETWTSDIPQGAIGVFHKDLVDQLDALTKCDTHEELGKSADGNYIYYRSTLSQADDTVKAALKEIKVEITDMQPLSVNDDVFSDMAADPNSASVANVGQFTTTDIYGKTYDQSIFSENDLTLVNVFATWCNPCVAEMPELQRVKDELGIPVVAIVLDGVNEKFEPVERTLEDAKFLAEQANISFPMILPDKTGLNGRLFDVTAVPETFFVDKNGNIVGEPFVGGRDFNQWKKVIESMSK